MPVLRMTVPCTIYRYQKADLHGTPQYDLKHPVKCKCSIVDVKDEDNKTTVRTDSSATKGNAREQTFDVRILLPRNVVPYLQDKVITGGYTLKIYRVSPRRNVVGVLDHYEVRCEHSKL